MGVLTSVIVLLIIALGVLGLLRPREVCAETEISASQSQAWQVLTAFEDYAQWNPFITQIIGWPSAQSDIGVTIRAPFIKQMQFILRVDSVKPESEMIWLGETLMPKVLDGRHYFRLNKTGEGEIRFSQGEIFSGVLLYFVWPVLSVLTRKNFNDMNAGFKGYLASLSKSAS